MKKIVFLLIIPLFYLYPVEREIEIGNRSWNFSGIDSIDLKQNNTGSSFVSLKDGEYTVDSRTMLLLHFNNQRSLESTGRYQIEGNSYTISEKIKKLGRGAALFNGENDSVKLEAGLKSFFPDRVYSGDFSVEFWIYAQNASDGETVFLYENYTDNGDKILPQLFRCYLADRKLVWQVKNIFIPFDRSPFEIILSGNSRLIPKKWSHHLLRYKADTGVLEYLLDGVPEAIVHVNRERREVPWNYPFYAGENGRIVIADGFTGAIDEFRIKNEWIEDFSMSMIGKHEGFFITDLIDLNHSKSEIYQIECRDNIPEGTDISYSYILSDSPEPPENDSERWQVLSEGKMRISGGRFLYIRGSLYSDGERNISPTISWIKIKYDEPPPPPPPSVVKAEALDGSVSLKWSGVPDSDIDGYFIYFGEKPGRYFGKQLIMLNHLLMRDYQKVLLLITL